MPKKILYEASPSYKISSRKITDSSTLNYVEMSGLSFKKPVHSQILVPDEETVERLSIAKYVKVDNLNFDDVDLVKNNRVLKNQNRGLKRVPVSFNKTTMIAPLPVLDDVRIINRRRHSCPSLLWLTIFAAIILSVQCLFLYLFYFTFNSNNSKSSESTASTIPTTSKTSKFSTETVKIVINPISTTFTLTFSSATTTSTATATTISIMTSVVTTITDSKLTITATTKTTATITEATKTDTTTAATTTDTTTAATTTATTSSITTTKSTISTTTIFVSQSIITTTIITTKATSSTERTSVNATSLTDSIICETVLDCQHNGEFDEDNCNCMCLPAYEGYLCEIILCDRDQNFCGLDTLECSNELITYYCPKKCGLCKDSCQELECENSGNFNLETCVCECYAGYSGESCEILNCDGTQPDVCNMFSFDQCKNPFIASFCPVLCRKCEGDMCLELECKNGGEFNSITCSCICLSSWSGLLCEILECGYQPEICDLMFSQSQCLESQFLTYFCPKLCGLCPEPCIELECENNGDWDEEECSCDCVGTAWSGNTCNILNCDYEPNICSSYDASECIVPFFYYFCPKVCGICNGSLKTTTLFICEELKCQNGEFDRETCSCVCLSDNWSGKLCNNLQCDKDEMPLCENIQKLQCTSPLIRNFCPKTCDLC